MNILPNGNYMRTTILLGTLLLASAAAHAQYAWIDAKGVHHYSDRPPPADTPAAKVLKAPHGMMPSNPPTSEPAKSAPTLAERETDYRKRHADADAAEQKAAAAKQAADAKRINCQAAVANKAQVETGRRLRWDEAGHANDIMTEDDKAKEVARADAALKDC